MSTSEITGWSRFHTFRSAINFDDIKFLAQLVIGYCQQEKNIFSWHISFSETVIIQL